MRACTHVCTFTGTSGIPLSPYTQRYCTVHREHGKSRQVVDDVVTCDQASSRDINRKLHGVMYSGDCICHVSAWTVRENARVNVQTTSNMKGQIAFYESEEQEAIDNPSLVAESCVRSHLSEWALASPHKSTSARESPCGRQGSHYSQPAVLTDLSSTECKT